jgi:hypothetical protein
MGLKMQRSHPSKNDFTIYPTVDFLGSVHILLSPLSHLRCEKFRAVTEFRSFTSSRRVSEVANIRELILKAIEGDRHEDLLLLRTFALFENRVSLSETQEKMLRLFRFR